MVKKEQVAELMRGYFPKCPICGSDAGYEVSGFFKTNVQCHSCEAKWDSNDFIGGKELKKLRLDEAAKDGRGLEFLAKEFPVDFWQKLEIKTEINWKAMPKPKPEMAKVLLLEEGEEILTWWDGDREVFHTAVEKGRVERAKATQRGCVVLTSRRLFWVIKRGVFGESYHPFHEIPLEAIKGVSGGGTLSKYVSVTDSQGENIFHLRIPKISGNIDFIKFSPVLQSAIKARREEIEAKKRTERVHVLLDFSFLKDYMNKGRLSLETLKCPSCGAPVRLPESGNQLECKHCGSIIYAQDVFEKVKLLIG
jgi:ribosomal protein S27AE